jgi:hypothetical protein
LRIGKEAKGGGRRREGTGRRSSGGGSMGGCGDKVGKVHQLLDCFINICETLNKDAENKKK